jgi:hypothetical protein
VTVLRKSAGFRRLHSLGDGRFFLLALLPLLVIYLATANWGMPKTDALTNTLAAWNLGTKASVTLDEHGELADDGVSGVLAYVVDVEGTPVSNYPPGAALLAAPLYAVWPQDAETLPPGDSDRWDDLPIDLVLPPIAPAAITAALATALAVALAGLTVRPTVGSSTALVGTYVFGLATGAWGVAADALWQHGPAMLWISLAVWSASKDRYWLGGLAFGAAILTRPLAAVIAAATGLTISIKNRDWRPTVQLGVGSALGLALLIWYNAQVFGSASVSGGYSPAFRENVLNFNLWWYIRNVAGGLFDPALGVLALSPFIILLVIGAFRSDKPIAPSLLGASVGGVLYLLIQWKANRHSGGDGFVGYRYPLEALAAAAPALFLGVCRDGSFRPGRSPGP